MSLAAWATPFFTTDQNGSDAWPWVTTARWMLPRPPEVEVLVDVELDVQASWIAARPGTAATAAPATADFLKRSRRVRSVAISHLRFVFESDQALEEDDAAANVPDWAHPGLRFRRQHDILLQHVPTAIAGCFAVAHQCTDVDDACVERSEQTLPYGVTVWQVATPDSSYEKPVDILQVHVPDPRPRGRRQLNRVHAADEQVAGVKAEAGVGELEQAAHVLRALDDGSCVWVEGQLQVMAAGDLLGTSQAGQQGGPGRPVQCLASVVTAAGSRCDYEDVPTGLSHRRRDLTQLVNRSVRQLWPVQHGRDEAGGQLEAGGVEQAGDCGRIGGEIAGRAQLGRPQPCLADLGQHSLGLHLVPPAGHLADAPGDGRPGKPRHPISSTRTGRCSRRDCSAASAEQSARRASSPEQALSPRSRTASRKVCSSARYALSNRSMKSRWPLFCGAAPGSTDRRAIRSSIPTAMLSREPSSSSLTSYPSGSYRLPDTMPSAPLSNLSMAAARSRSS